MAGLFDNFNADLNAAISSPLFNLGTGLLSVAGPSREPQSLGMGLMRGAGLAQQAQKANLRNQLLRGELEKRSRQREASERLKGLLGGQGGGQVGPTNAAAQRLQSGQNVQQALGGGNQQQQLLGLLAEVAPQQVAQGLLGQMFPAQRRPNSLIEQAQFAFPNDEEAQRRFVTENVQRGGGTSEQLDQILKTMQIQNLQQEREDARTEKDRKRIDARISVLNGIDAIQEAAQINERLRGTMGETGLGLNELRRTAAGGVSALVDLFGGDASRARQVAADLQRLNQLTTREAIQSLFGAEQSVGTVTDRKLGTFLQTKPGVENLPETNNKIFADMLQSKLNSAEKLGIEVPNRAQIQARIDALKGGGRDEATPRQTRGRQPSRPKVLNFSDLPD